MDLPYPGIKPGSPALQVDSLPSEPLGKLRFTLQFIFCSPKFGNPGFTIMFSTFILWRRDRLPTPVFLGFPCGLAGKESTRNAGDLGPIPGSRLQDLRPQSPSLDGTVETSCARANSTPRRYRAWTQSWSSAALAARSVLPSHPTAPGRHRAQS